MKRFFYFPFVALSLLALFSLLFPRDGFCLYDAGDETGRLAILGYADLAGSVARYPDDRLLYPESKDALWSGDLRLIGEWSSGSRLSGQCNILQHVGALPSTSTTRPTDVERSGFFYLEQHASNNSLAALLVDNCLLRWADRDNELTVGRQPYSGSVTFTFTPNDFFAPFTPATFFKVYKPGVDGLRFEKKLGSFSQLTLLGVLGYAKRPGSKSGWSNSPELARTSLLARVTHGTENVEWGATAGVVRQAAVYGFSLQTELFGEIGVRAEGHYTHAWGEEVNSGLRVAAGIEYRFSPDLDLRLEYLFNGFGESSAPVDLESLRRDVAGPDYPGRHYTALGLGGQLTPLLTGEALLLRNWSDNSWSLSLYGVLSLSDESELAVTASFPGGDAPHEGKIHSELGAAPLLLSLEYRFYF